MFSALTFFRHSRQCESVIIVGMMGISEGYFLSQGADEVCALCLGEVCGDVKNPLHQWEVQFPEVPKPVTREPDLPKVRHPHLENNHTSRNFSQVYQLSKFCTCRTPTTTPTTS